MNKNLLTVIALGIILIAVPAQANFMDHIRDNKETLGLISLTIASHNAKSFFKDKIKELPKTRQKAVKKHIFNIGEPTINLILAFGIHQLTKPTPVKWLPNGEIDPTSGYSVFRKSIDNLKNIATIGHDAANDPVETIFSDGGKIFGTAGAIYTIGKYAYKRMYNLD